MWVHLEVVSVRTCGGSGRLSHLTHVFAMLERLDCLRDTFRRVDIVSLICLIIVLLVLLHFIINAALVMHPEMFLLS